MNPRECRCPCGELHGWPSQVTLETEPGSERLCSLGWEVTAGALASVGHKLQVSRVHPVWETTVSIGGKYGSLAKLRCHPADFLCSFKAGRSLGTLLSPNSSCGSRRTGATRHTRGKVSRPLQQSEVLEQKH